MRELSHELKHDILHVSNDEITPVSEMSGQLKDYFIQGRHKNCSVIYLSERFYKNSERYSIKLFSLLHL